MKDGEEDGTLGSVSYGALTILGASEQNLPGAERLKRGRLAQRIVASPVLDLKAEEIALLKTCIGNVYGPWIVVQAEDMLESQEPTKLSVA